MPVGIEQHIGDLLNANLGQQDYLAISNFFKGNTNFNRLSLEQRRILDSFHLMDSQLSNELITKQATLLNMLHRDKVLTDSQLREVQQVDQSFSFMFRDKKYRNGKFDNNFTNDLTDLVQTQKRNLWNHRIDEAYEHFRDQNYFSELSTAESRSVKSAFREEFENHLKTGKDYIGRRYREDMGFEQVRDLTHPEVPELFHYEEVPELFDLPDVPQHWTGRVPNLNPELDLTIPDSMMHDIALGTVRFERAMQQDVMDNPLATDFDLIRQFETIPSEVPDAQINAWLTEHNDRTMADYKNNFAIWDEARANMNDLTKVSEGWSSSRHSTVTTTEDTSYSGQSSLNREYFNAQQDNLSNLSQDLRSVHTESELLLQSERNSEVLSSWHTGDYSSSGIYDGIPNIETPVPRSMQSIARTYIENNLEDAIALAGDGSVLLNGAGMLKWLGKNATAMAAVAGIQEVVNWLIKNSNMSGSAKKYLDIGVSGMVALTGIALQPENPLGWLAGLAIPVMQAITFFAMPHAKRVLNDNPLEIYGRRWGMVRARDDHGKMCWYLGFSGSKKEWAIAFAANSTIRMNYGKLSDLIFLSERDGTIKPHFMGPKHQKEFDISTRDWNDKHRGLSKMHGEDWMYAEKKYQQKYDPLRDWYLFSDKDRTQMYEDLVKGENLQKYRDHVDDRKNMGTYTKSLLDLHDGVAFIEKWKRNYGEDDITVDAFGNYGLRRVANESGLFMSQYDWDKTYHSNLIGPRDNLQNAKSQDELFKQFKIEKKNLSENQWTLEYFAKQSKDLLRTQREAANMFGYKALQKEPGLNEYYWRLYNPSTGYSPARSAIELEKQAKEIYKRSIPTAQKKFLAQKVISRYLLQELADRDLGNNVWNYGFGEDHRTWSKSTDKTKAPDYRGVFSPEQVQINGKWTGLPSPFSESGEANTPEWLGVSGGASPYTTPYHYLGSGLQYRDPYPRRTGPSDEKALLETQVSALTNLLQKKYKLPVLKPVKVIPGLQKISELSAKMQKLYDKAKKKAQADPKWDFLKYIAQHGSMGSKKKNTKFYRITDDPTVVDTKSYGGAVVDTSGTDPGRPEQSGGEHSTRFFDRKGNEIIKDKTGKPVKHDIKIPWRDEGPLPPIPEKNGTIIDSNPGTIIKSNPGTIVHSKTIRDTTWTTHKHTEAEYDELMQYLREQHGLSKVPNVSWLLKDQEQHVVLKTDTHLHERLNLPDYIRVVQEGHVIHQQIDPEKYIPRFAGDKTTVTAKI